VSSERRLGVDDDNEGRLYEQVLATAFVAHPYQFPIIGWPSDIAGWTQEEIEAFFNTYYAPNNCTMVFTGAVSPEEIFLLAEQYLAPISKPTHRRRCCTSRSTRAARQTRKHSK
jgi:zinc protease